MRKLLAENKKKNPSQVIYYTYNKKHHYTKDYTKLLKKILATSTSMTANPEALQRVSYIHYPIQFQA